MTNKSLAPSGGPAPLPPGAARAASAIVVDFGVIERPATAEDIHHLGNPKMQVGDPVFVDAQSGALIG